MLAAAHCRLSAELRYLWLVLSLMMMMMMLLVLRCR
jgi:hypothetical protein